MRAQILLAAAILVAGCGGGGSSSSGSANTFRQLTSGSVFNYTPIGTVTQGSTIRNVLGGSRSLSVLASTTAGSSLRFETVDAIVFPDLTTTGDIFTQFVSQSSTTGEVSLHAYSRGGTTRTATLALPIVPGTFEIGGTNNQTVAFNGGTSFTQTFTVAAVENLTVPAGSFRTFRVTYTSNDGAGRQVSGTIWYAPTIGAPVRLQEVVTLAGETQNISWSLSSYSLGAP